MEAQGNPQIPRKLNRLISPRTRLYPGNTVLELRVAVPDARTNLDTTDAHGSPRKLTGDGYRGNLPRIRIFRGNTLFGLRVPVPDSPPYMDTTGARGSPRTRNGDHGS